MKIVIDVPVFDISAVIIHSFAIHPTHLRKYSGVIVYSQGYKRNIDN